MNLRVAKRYYLALYDAAKKAKSLDKVAEDSANIIGLIQSNHNLLLFFRSPVIRYETKIKIVEILFKGKISILTLEFLKLLIKKSRENILLETLGGFILLKELHEGIIPATVKSAVSLDKDEMKKIKEKIDSYSGMNSKPVFNIDESLMGGFTLQIKDTVVDASIKRQLELLKIQFKKQNLKNVI